MLKKKLNLVWRMDFYLISELLEMVGSKEQQLNYYETLVILTESN